MNNYQYKELKDLLESIDITLNQVLKEMKKDRKDKKEEKEEIYPNPSRSITKLI